MGHTRREAKSGGVMEWSGTQQTVGLVDCGHLLRGAFADRFASAVQPVGMPLADLTPVGGADLLARACRGSSEKLVGMANGHVFPRFGEGLHLRQCRILRSEERRVGKAGR